MKKEWLFPNEIVPVDVETTAALVAEIIRLIKVVGGMALAQPEQKYELVTYGEVWSSDGETWSRDGKVMDLAQPEQEPTLQEQLAKAYADLEKALVDWDKAHVELQRVEQLIKEQA